MRSRGCRFHQPFKAHVQGKMSHLEHALAKAAIRENVLTCFRVRLARAVGAMSPWTCTQSLSEALDSMDVEVKSECIHKARKELGLSSDDGYAPVHLSVKLAHTLQQCWESPEIQHAYSLRHTFWLLDAAPYYFQHADRFALNEYRPTDEDLVMARARTTGVTETEFTDGHLQFKVVDVGGQRSERRKWIHCFDCVDAVVFVSSLVEFNQKLFEDDEGNRLVESFRLFREVLRCVARCQRLW
jgi:hypothetical protein